MSGRSDHNDWYELVAGHALHALDAPDEARLVKHLAHCDDCRAELDVHALTASHLASLADDAELVAPAWSSVRAAVIGTAPATVDAPPVVDELAQRRAKRQPGQWILAAAAAVLVLAGATVASWQVLGSNGSGNSQPGAIEHCSVQGCQEIELRSSEGVDRADVLVSDGSVQVQPLELSKPASGRTFVLWQLPHGGAPIPLGEFDSTTETSTAHPLAVSMAQTTAFAVSSELADTEPTTPTDVLALGGVTA
jgi:anti-sigma-K factor RskA